MGKVSYEPAESRSGLFGGNSNWRGPVWFPLNYLIIEALQKFDWYYGSTFRVEHPTGSGRMLTLWEVSVELSRRLIGLFVRHEGRRAIFGAPRIPQRNDVKRRFHGCLEFARAGRSGTRRCAF